MKALNYFPAPHFNFPVRAEVGREFVRGAITTGVLAAMQNGAPHWNRQTTRLALQGGAALATGVAATRAWQNGQTAQALMSVAIGAGAVYALEKWLQDAPKMPAQGNE